jgi:FtsH-binding integral membrane protein
MNRHPNFKADLFVFGIIVFLMGVVFSMFVLEKDHDARFSLFAISAWILVICVAAYIRLKRKDEESEDDDSAS